MLIKGIDEVSMAKKTNDKSKTKQTPQLILKLQEQPGIPAFLGYFLISALLTFPLIFRMNSSVYGFYDHISTDLFSNIHFYFWMLKKSVIDMHSSPMETTMFAAPFGSRMNFVNFTGFVQLPLTALFGHVFSRNFAIMFNLVFSAFGMFCLVRHVTKSAPAAFLAGIVFAFCPNMMVRSYTTFDSTQVQWIPFYTLFMIRFIEDRTWKNALLTGFFLICNILFAMPYFLLFLPFHTIAVLLVIAAWKIWAEKRGFDGLIRDLSSSNAIKGWIKIGCAFAIVLAVFFAYYQVIVGGGEYSSTIQRTTDDLRALSLKPTDYLMPHPRSFLLKGDIKESYWNSARPGKDPDSFVAYIGFIALGLAALGYVKGRKLFRWVFFAAAIIAFWATLGPSVFGMPSPSGLIYHLYAPFARRILLYKVYVQFGIAGLAGLGAAWLFNNESFAGKGARYGLLAGLAATMLLEYSIVPPALSVNLEHNPEIYELIKQLPDESIVFELPHKKYSGNMFQGYAYYQTVHGKRLFNPMLGLSQVPDKLQPFYENMEVPLEAQSYANLAALRYLGVNYLTYHWMIGTRTVGWPSMLAPGFIEENIDGVRKIYSCTKNPETDYFESPYDYTFADLYEITTEPCPVALIFDYHNPYEPVRAPGQGDGRFEYGWASAIVDTTAGFYCPLAENGDLIRLLRQDGRISAVNLSDKAIDFSLSFTASAADTIRIIDVSWNGGDPLASFEIGPETVPCLVEGLSLAPGASGELTIHSRQPLYAQGVTLLGKEYPLPAMGVLRNFMVETQ